MRLPYGPSTICNSAFATDDFQEWSLVRLLGGMGPGTWDGQRLDIRARYGKGGGELQLRGAAGRPFCDLSSCCWREEKEGWKERDKGLQVIAVKK